MTDDIDIFEDGASEGPSEGDLTRLGAEVQKVLDLDDQIEGLQQKLKLLQKDRTRLVEQEIPDAMEAADVPEFVSGDRRIILKRKIYASLPKDPEKRAVAFEIIHDNDGDDIIKNTVTAPFTKGQAEAAREALKLLSEAGYPAELDENIHASTYTAWINERVQAGASIDLEALGAYNRRFIDIKKEKKK